MALTAQEFRGMYAIIPTPATPDAAHYDAVDTVDTAETERLVERLIADGSSGIIALGTTGECATLSSRDYRTFVECVVATARGRVPVIVGSTALGGHEVVNRMRFLRELNVDATLLGLPMWQVCTDEMAVQYYAEIGKVLPDLPIMVYANARAFRYEFGVPFWTGIGQSATTVIAAKSSNPKDLLEKQRVTKGRVHLLPHENGIVEFHKIAPATTTACWATAASMGPAPAIAMVEAVNAGDEARIAELAAEIGYTHETLHDVIANPAVFASYNIQVEKIRIAEAGYCKPGPIRPPYNVIPPEMEEASRECGRRWAALHQKMTAAVTPA